MSHSVHRMNCELPYGKYLFKIDFELPQHAVARIKNHCVNPRSREGGSSVVTFVECFETLPLHHAGLEYVEALLYHIKLDESATPANGIPQNAPM